MKRVVALSFLVAACGGKSKPAPDPVEEKKVVEPPSDTGDDEGEEGGVEGGVPEEPPPPPEPIPPAMTGSWVGPCVHVRDGGQTLAATFTADTFDFVIDAFSDPECKTKHMTMHIAGTYTVGAESTTVPGTWEIEAVKQKHEITVATSKGARTIGKVCKIKKMKEKKTYDITTTGCPALSVHPAAECPTVHDLIAQEGSRAYLGMGGDDVDRCSAEKKPSTVDRSWALVYQWPSTGNADCDAMFVGFDGYLQCDKVDVVSRNYAFREVVQSLPSMIGAPPEAQQAVTDACKQGSVSIEQELSKLGCAAP